MINQCWWRFNEQQQRKPFYGRPRLSFLFCGTRSAHAHTHLFRQIPTHINTYTHAHTLSLSLLPPTHPNLLLHRFLSLCHPSYAYFSVCEKVFSLSLLSSFPPAMATESDILFARCCIIGLLDDAVDPTLFSFPEVCVSWMCCSLWNRWTLELLQSSAALSTAVE
jgi:hypothetical protein